MQELKLHNGSRIAIIGGGPAGTFFAHFALKLARQRDIDVTITILDGKNFLRQGPPGCNMCAGVISETLLARLYKEGIRLPEGRVQHRIDGYYVQAADSGLLLTHPQGKRGTIRTVYRGSGPRFWPETTGISFDDFLLSHVRKRGVQVVEQVVQDIILPSDAGQPIRLCCGRIPMRGGPGSQTQLEADLVVGAFGLNTSLLEKVVALGFGYRPPRFVHAFQAEIEVGADHIRRHLGNNIYVFSLGLRDIRFVALTPKKEHVTVSVLSSDNANLPDLRTLLAQPAVRRLFPPGKVLADRSCRCRPRIGITAARKPLTDRLVIVGDASCSRYFKNGIESAFLTAQLAAEAAFDSGVSKAAFSQEYWKRVKQTLVRDNLYGRLLFRVHDIASRHKLLTQTYYLVASSGRDDDPAAQLARQILWDMFTGNVPYRTIFFRGLDPRLQTRLTVTTMSLVAKKIRSLLSGRGQG